MASFTTADICETKLALLATGELRVLPPVFRIYGQRREFFGPVVTIKVLDDNAFVHELLMTNGEGRILVIDGGGSMRCALMGGILTQIGQKMGWAGVVVNGCIRDVDEINECDIGVRALASNPVTPVKKGIGEKHVVANISGVLVHDGEWLYADSDGIVISKYELSLEEINSQIKLKNEPF